MDLVGRMPAGSPIVPTGRPLLTLAITDSGLGGLGATAHIVARLAAITAPPDSSVRVVFMNAQHQPLSGYNRVLPERASLLFGRALTALQEQFQPNAIVVACNTLSALLARTPFAATTQIPIVNILDAGAALLTCAAKEHPSAPFVVLATKTTIDSGFYQQALLKARVAENRCIPQGCPDLAGQIELGGPHMEQMVGRYVVQAVAELRRRALPVDPVYAALCCTHYGLITERFERAFTEAGVTGLRILDPNARMLDDCFDYLPSFLEPREKERTSWRPLGARLQVEVVSQVLLTERLRTHLAPLLHPYSPQVAEALRDYRFEPELFPWQDLVPLHEDRPGLPPLPEDILAAAREQELLKGV